MALYIRWTPRAKQDYDVIKDYLTNEWGRNVAESFEKRLKEFTDLLSEFPNIGSIELEKKTLVDLK